MKPLMSEKMLQHENTVHTGTGGRSEENSGLGFKPAFLDFQTQKIYPSRFADGRLARSTADGLPTKWVGTAPLPSALCRKPPHLRIRAQRFFYTRSAAPSRQGRATSEA